MHIFYINEAATYICTIQEKPSLKDIYILQPKL